MMTTSRFVLNKIGKYRQEHNLDFETIDKLMDVNVMEIVDEYDLDNNIVNHDLYTSWSEEAYDLIPRLIENGYTNRAIAMVFSTTYKATESFVSSSIDCKFSDFWNTNGRVGKSQEATPINLDLYFKKSKKESVEFVERPEKEEDNLPAIPRFFDSYVRTLNCECCGDNAVVTILVSETEGRYYLPNQRVRARGDHREMSFCHSCMRKVEDNFRETIKSLETHKD